MKSALRLPCLLLAAFAAHGPSPDPAQPDKKLLVGWQGATYVEGKLPEELTPVALQTIEGWAGWAREHEYRMELSADQRVLFLSKGKAKWISRQIELIEETLEFFDGFLPVPESRHAASEEKEGNDGEGEAPDTGDGGLEVTVHDDGYVSWEWNWGDYAPLESETCVLLEVDTEDDFKSLLQYLMNAHEYLMDWAFTATNLTGFVLERPLAACWIAKASGQEEWDPRNELVHRVTQMLILRDYGRQPYWLQTALAWHAEWVLRKGIYCYPYRDEFVWATEHTGWESELKKLFKKRKKEPFDIQEVSSWARGTWDSERAAKAWGVTEYLARFHPESIVPLLDEARILREERERVYHDDGTWERTIDYQLTADEQRKLIAKHTREDFLEEVHEFFKRGKSFKPSK